MENSNSSSSIDKAFDEIIFGFEEQPDLFSYDKAVMFSGYRVELYIDIDMGGGFESGFATTILRAKLETDPDFRFALHHEDFFDEIGKFLGMEDIEIGFVEFDKKVIIKTDDEHRVRRLFSDSSTRKVFGDMKGYNLGLNHHHDHDIKESYLELEMEEGITDPLRLKPIFFAFCDVLKKL